MTAIAFETTGPLAVITMTHEPHNLLGPDLMEPLLDALQRASSQHARAVLAVSAASPRLRSTGGAGLAVCAAMGNPHPFSVRAAAGGMRRAWSGGGTDPVE